MQNVFTRKPALWTKWFIASLLSLLLCLPLAAEQPKKLPKPLYVKTVTLRVEVYANREQVTQVCNSKDATLVNGCHWNYGHDTHRVAVIKPDDWCDWKRLKTLGHELWHVMGTQHSPQHVFLEGLGENSWVAKNCEVVQ
jgi:hypothetical protein